MRVLSALLLYAFSVAVQAAQITIDFDGAENPFDPITGNSVMTVPQGFYDHEQQCVFYEYFGCRLFYTSIARGHK